MPGRRATVIALEAPNPVGVRGGGPRHHRHGVEEESVEAVEPLRL